MTVNEIIKGIAKQLEQLYPDKMVYVDEIRRGANENFCVHCIDQAHTRNLDRRRTRSYSFEILYFKAEKDSMNFNDWAEGMYWGFERIQVGDRILTPIDAQAEDGGDMVYHFMFDINLTGLIDKSAGEPMSGFRMEGGLKDE